jgi:hypothetical protein
MQKDVTTSWSTFDHGRTLLTESALRLTTTSVKCEVGVTVRAATGNSGKIYIGNSDVTKDTNPATDGYELAAGQTITIAVNNVNKVYAIGSVNPQTAYWIAV